MNKQEEDGGGRLKEEEVGGNRSREKDKGGAAMALRRKRKRALRRPLRVRGGRGDAARGRRRGGR